MRKLALLFLLVISCDRPQPNSQADIGQIDKQIESLESRLEELRSQANNQESEAQADFLNEWNDFSKKMEKVQAEEIEADHIKERINELQKSRKEILERQAK